MWITLTTADITGLAPAEITQVNRIAGNENLLAQMLDQVTREVRGYVGRQFSLGPDGTIPDEMKDSALSLVTWKFVNSIPSKTLATDPRKNAADDARTMLRDVAAGKFSIVPPDTTAPVQNARPSIGTIQPGNPGMSADALSRL